MSTSHEPNSYDPGQPIQAETPPTEKGNLLWYCLGGCLIMLIVGVILFAVATYFLITKSKEIAVSAARGAMVSMVNESELSDDDKREVIEQIDRVADDYKEGKITLEQVGEIVEKLGESPLLSVGLVYVIEQKYVKGSGLSDEEKAEAHITLQRAARGVFEKTLTEEQVEATAGPIMREDSDGSQMLKETVTDEELRTFLADLKQLVDDNQIPDEEFKIEVGAEFRKAVDKVYENQ